MSAKSALHQKVGLGAFNGTKIKSLTTPFLGTGPNGADYDERYCYHIGYMFGDEEWTGSYAAWDSVSEVTYYLPNTLKTVTITKQIKESAFENAEKIENIIIKNTVEATVYPDNFAKIANHLNLLFLRTQIKLQEWENSLSSLALIWKSLLFLKMLPKSIWRLLKTVNSVVLNYHRA